MFVSWHGCYFIFLFFFIFHFYFIVINTLQIDIFALFIHERNDAWEKTLQNNTVGVISKNVSTLFMNLCVIQYARPGVCRPSSGFLRELVP